MVKFNNNLFFVFMLNQVVIVNAFELDDFFISQLSQEYEKYLVKRDIIPEVFYVNRMNFSFTPFPEQFTLQTLEQDLQRCVNAIKMASTLAIFTSTHKDQQTSAFRQFITRLFHLKSGIINHNIWGNMSAHNKVLRIITVLNDPHTWKEFHRNRNRWIVPMPKATFGLFGFGQIYSRTFGFLKDNDMNNVYAQKSLKAMRNMAEKD